MVTYDISSVSLYARLADGMYFISLVPVCISSFYSISVAYWNSVFHATKCLFVTYLLFTGYYQYKLATIFIWAICYKFHYCLKQLPCYVQCPMKFLATVQTKIINANLHWDKFDTNKLYYHLLLGLLISS